MESNYEVVYLVEERRVAALISRGAHASVVRYTTLGTVFEVTVPNDEIAFLGTEDWSDDTED